MVRKYKYKCSVSGCKSIRGDTKLFSIPRDQPRRRKWLNFCKNKDLLKLYFNYTKYSREFYICSKHFETKYFEENNREGALSKIALPVPTLNPPTAPDNGDEIPDIEEEELSEYWVIVTE